MTDFVAHIRDQLRGIEPAWVYRALAPGGVKPAAWRTGSRVSDIAPGRRGRTRRPVARTR